MIHLPGFRGTIERNHPLALHTTWRVGGPAEIFAVPEDQNDLLCLLAAVKSQGWPLFVLGRGSNVLIDDAGLPGVTVQLGRAFQYLTLDAAGTLQVGAGFPMPALARRVAALGFTGYEHLIGIPGTVGAGVVINAGKGTYDGSDMRSSLESVTYIDAGLQLMTESVQGLELGYRSSRLKGTCSIVVEAAFGLKTLGDPAEIRAKLKSILAERRAKFPLNRPNAGSVFKRPPGQPPAGWLIEAAGLKGFRIGGAQVSPIHANFIVNLGQATSNDIKALMDVVYEKVLQVHGVALEREIVFLPEQSNW